MIYLGIGSNLGDRRKNIEIAKFEIAQIFTKVCLGLTLTILNF